MNKLLVICGPTATGKTQLGINLAKKFDGEIISADSRQVYRGMNIGTGKEISNIKYQKSKIQIKNQNFLVYKLVGIPVWLWDLVEPNEEFSVAQYVELAWGVIEDIWQRGKLPILIGGTGFYIKVVIGGIESLGIGPDWELRQQLQSHKVTELQRIIKEICPERWQKMNESDRQNPRRLIRAIEVAISNKKLATQMTHLPAGKAGKKNREHRGDILFIGLMAPYKILYQRIDKRVDERINKGVVEEIKNLLNQGYSWENSVLGTTIGYKEWQPYFEKQVSLEQVIERWKYDEHAYARRQMTWFKKALRQAQGYWFDITERGGENKQSLILRNKVEKLVSSWYTGKQNAKKD